MRFSLFLVCVAACGSVKQQPGTDSFTCPANEFISCDGNIATSCNAAGDGTATMDCGAAGCNADAKRCNMCSPNALSCGASTVDHCGPDGLPVSQDICPAGCIDMPTPHCAYLEPRYLPDICDAPATMPDFTVDTTTTFDTGAATTCTGGVVTQTGGPEICVVRFGTITINQAAAANIVGTRALALVADTAITIDGTLEISAKTTTNGPGGGGTSGAQAATTTGGGGAGFHTAGAAGGSAAADGGGGAGGAAGTDPSLLTALVGGTRPANSIQIGPAVSGGAGGAATLIACRGTVSVSGMIAANGGGGNAGSDELAGPQILFVSGAGGGAGGNVVLQGLAITVTGQIFANGGGGGAGTNTNDAAGLRGSDGLRSTSPAPGGGSTAGEGVGGNGGAANNAPGIGHHPTGGTAGGGGGSVGFFQSYTPQNVTPTLTPSAASPGFQQNKTIQTR